MQQLGSHWVDFYELLYFNIFQKYVEEFETCLKPDYNNGYFT